jgi:uncharacterized protein YlxW (UPF0749 family)
VWRALVPALLVVIGLLLATSARMASGTDVRAERRTDLVDLIRVEQQRLDAVTARVGDLRQQVDAVAAQKAPLPRDRSLEHLVSEVEGPGLVVELQDAPIPASGVPAGYTADDFVVHEQDVQAVVNALWAGGAEAVAVMDQRIVGTSAVRCVGNTLLLHGRVYAPPYTVSAVGPADRLQRALEASPQVALYRRYADLIGLGYTVDGRDAVTVPPYDGTLTVRYAKVGP